MSIKFGKFLQNPLSEKSITGIAIMNIYSDVIKSFLIHTVSLFLQPQGVVHKLCRLMGGRGSQKLPILLSKKTTKRG